MVKRIIETDFSFNPDTTILILIIVTTRTDLTEGVPRCVKQLLLWVLTKSSAKRGLSSFYLTKRFTEKYQEKYFISFPFIVLEQNNYLFVEDRSDT